MVNNSKVINLSRRVRRVEEKLAISNQGGIADWAIDYARSVARSNERFYDFQLAVSKVLRKKHGNGLADPEPPGLRKEDNLLAFAKGLSDKYPSLEAYKTFMDLQPLSIDFDAFRKVLEGN